MHMYICKIRQLLTSYSCYFKGSSKLAAWCPRLKLAANKHAKCLTVTPLLFFCRSLLCLGTACAVPSIFLSPGQLASSHLLLLLCRTLHYTRFYSTHLTILYIHLLPYTPSFSFGALLASHPTTIYFCSYAVPSTTHTSTAPTFCRTLPYSYLQYPLIPKSPYFRFLPFPLSFLFQRYLRLAAAYLPFLDSILNLFAAYQPIFIFLNHIHRFVALKSRSQFDTQYDA